MKFIYIIAMVGLILPAFGLAYNPDFDPTDYGVTYYYSFDNSSGLKDLFGNSDGSNSGAEVGKPGFINNSYDFVGTDVVTFTKALIPPNNDWFLCSWQRMNTFSGTYQMLYMQYTSGVTPGRFWIASIDGVQHVFLHGAIVFYSDISFLAQSWVHVCVTEQASTSNFTMYINGTYAGSAIKTNNIEQHVGEMGYEDVSGLAFNGRIDNTMVGNDTYLTPTNAMELYLDQISSPASYFGSDDFMIATHAPENDTDLILYLPFERNFDDESPEQKNNVSDYLGDVIIDVKGAVGQSTEYDSTGDRLIVPNEQDFDFGSRDFAVSLWYYGQNSGDWFLNKANLTTWTTKNSFAMKVNSNQALFRLWNTSAGTQDIWGPTNLPQNEWIHMGMAKSGNEFMMFINGNNTHNTTLDSNFVMMDTEYPVTVGSLSDGASSHNGRLDEIRIYNRSLSAVEFSEQYSMGRNNDTVDYGYAPSISFNSSDAVGLSFDVAWFKDGVLDRKTGDVNDANLMLWLPLDNDIKDYTNQFTTTNYNVDINNTNNQVGGGSCNFVGGSNDNYILVSDEQRFDFGTGDFTFNMWYYAQTSGAWFFNKANNSVWSTKGSFAMKVNNNQALFRVWNTTGGQWSVWGPTNLPQNEWIMFTFMKQSDKLLMYVDGENTHNTTLDTDFEIMDTVFPLRVGNLIDSTGHKGQLDEIRIYNKSLTSTEVKQIYDATRWAGLTVPRSDTSNGDNWTVQITPFSSTTAGTPTNKSILLGTAADVSQCTYSGSGDWVIDDGSDCAITTENNIGNNHLRILNGTFRINSGGKVRADAGCFVQDGQGIFVGDGGALYCES
ncbi:MAG: LamG-like jellyroll fold domain-containing protein [Nanoarchaeota archaeon]|nr:LamG-like jellyroll fold domain-containing protein [Nanoarchaeota archaeon]